MFISTLSQTLKPPVPLINTVSLTHTQHTLPHSVLHSHTILNFVYPPVRGAISVTNLRNILGRTDEPTTFL